MKGKVFLTAALFMLGIMTLFFTACGGGGDGDSVEYCIQEWDDWSKDHAPLPDSDNLEDTYSMTGFTVDIYEDGTYLGTLDENDFYSWAGTMTIGATNISQTISLEGDTMFISATYTNSPIDTYTGTLHINQSGSLYDVGYTISGNILTTDSGLQCEKVSQGVSVQHLETGEPGIGALVDFMSIY